MSDHCEAHEMFFGGCKDCSVAGLRADLATVTAEREELQAQLLGKTGLSEGWRKRFERERTAHAETRKALLFHIKAYDLERAAHAFPAQEPWEHQIAALEQELRETAGELEKTRADRNDHRRISGIHEQRHAEISRQYLEAWTRLTEAAELLERVARWRCWPEGGTSDDDLQQDAKDWIPRWNAYSQSFATGLRWRNGFMVPL